MPDARKAGAISVRIGSVGGGFGERLVRPPVPPLLWSALQREAGRHVLAIDNDCLVTMDPTNRRRVR